MNGLLLVDKPGGCTSHDVVARVRRLVGEKSVGHMGTLDPMATGLLPLLLGKWTRLAQFFGDMEKRYTGVIRFGYATDTFDAEGARAGETVTPQITEDALRSLAQSFLGESEQMPPAYSAKKIDGKPAYALARAGKMPELRPHRILISEFSIDGVAIGPEDTLDAQFTLAISSGGYVRSVAHAMGATLGCGAHLAALRRVAAGPFRVEDALTLEQIEQRAVAGRLSEMLPHPRTLMPHLPSVSGDASTLARMKNGMQVPLPEFSRAPRVKVFGGQNELAGIADRIAGVLFQPNVVLL